MSTTMRAMQRPHARATPLHHPTPLGHPTPMARPVTRPVPNKQPDKQPDKQSLGVPCKAADPELFFAETPAGVEAAKALCGGCALRISCLASAIDRREPFGVWGGELFDGGAIVPRKRPRGRPRKSDAERDAAWFDEHADVLSHRGGLSRAGRATAAVA